jgi:hypothetical protein
MTYLAGAIVPDLSSNGLHARGSDLATTFDASFPPGIILEIDHYPRRPNQALI